MYELNQTVAAVSTPYGRGAIAMIRVTGPEALALAGRVFIPKRKIPLSALDTGLCVYGMMLSDGVIVDDGMATVYRAPHSYTGEDMVELCCHGGILVTQVVLQSLFDAGAIPAGPGEFTRRAFLNGKMRLSQAEAIMDVIDAESIGKLKLAGAAGRGKLSGKIEEMYSTLKTLIASAYAYIDYPDEDLTDVSTEKMEGTLSELIRDAGILKDGYKAASAVNEGVKTVICGKPNVGKSSLLNLLSGEDVAIVTDIAGTTRDVITKTVMCGEVMLRLSDTAGIHRTSDTVESLGVKRAVDAMNSAGLILAVFDGTQMPDSEDRELISLLKKSSCEIIAVINKSDKGDMFASVYESEFENSVRISAKSTDGTAKLKELIKKLFIKGGIDYDAPHISNARQYSEISRAYKSLVNAKAALDGGLTQDIACLDLEEALGTLARLDGREVTEDIVSEIFSKFCVGK